MNGSSIFEILNQIYTVYYQLDQTTGEADGVKQDFL